MTIKDKKNYSFDSLRLFCQCEESWNDKDNSGRGIEVLSVLVAVMLLQTADSDPTSATYASRDQSVQKCPLPLTVLDFVINSTEPNVEAVWPCEVRFYWLSLKPFVKIVRFLIGYVTPLIIIVGFLLNTISFAMLNMPVLNDSNLSLYLKALAISDNGALIFNYAVGIARSHSTFVNDLFMNSRFLCGMNSVIMELFQFTSTWLVVSLTWARVFAMIFPFGALDTSRNRCAVISITALSCISFVISLTKLYSGGYETDSIFEFVPCQKKIRPWGSAMNAYIALSTWLPLLCIFIGNLSLILQMRKSTKIHNQLTQNFRQKINKGHHTSRTLFAVSIVYLILLLPLGIVETLELYWDVILSKHPANDADENEEYIHWLKQKMLLKWCRGLFFHVYHWNFAINFFLYYLTGEKFRNVVIQSLKNYKDALLSTNIFNCFPWSKCSSHWASMRRSSVLLVRVITLSEQSINSNVTAQINGNGVTVV